MNRFKKNKVNKRTLPHSEGLYSCSAVAGPFMLNRKNEYETTIDIYNILSANEMCGNPFLIKRHYPTSSICLKKHHNSMKLYNFETRVFEDATTTLHKDTIIDNVINNDFKLL